MANSFFKFKQFTVHQDQCAMKVTTDACLFGAWVADTIKNDKLKINNCIDIGAGTGLLSLMVAQQNKNLVIQSIELDADAAAQAKENVNQSTFNNRIEIIATDILSFQPTKPYDCIISNPPFYENELQSGNSKKNTAHHSTDLSLSKLLAFIYAHLTEHGIFFLLLPYKRNDEIISLLQGQHLFIHEKILLRPSAKHDWFRIMIQGSKKESINSKEGSITIQKNEKEYSNEFITLLKDYYLYLKR
jgi:tRNA1Val (adenine37-N6)-methyltransferase